MFKTRNLGEISLIFATLGLVGYAAFIENRTFIYYWYWESRLEGQYIKGIPLKMYGACFFLACNGLHVLQLFTYFRCVLTDPGIMRPGQEPNVKSPNVKHAICDKSKVWKPVRAHYCRECCQCVFKMDHHCPWINNCVGHRNMKYFMLLNLYTCVSSLMLIACVVTAFYNLVRDHRRHRIHLRQEWYMHVFGASVVALVQGAFFAYSCFELLREQISSLDDNQSYVDDLKNQYGKQQDIFSQAKLTLGTDWLWWLVPTRPCLETNHYEKVWPKKEVKKMYKENKFDMDQEDSDPHKRTYFSECRKSSVEKVALTAIITGCAYFWVYHGQQMLLDYCQWPASPVLPTGKKGTNI